jgi:hypothetical protein
MIMTWFSHHQLEMGVHPGIHQQCVLVKLAHVCATVTQWKYAKLNAAPFLCAHHRTLYTQISVI